MVINVLHSIGDIIFCEPIYRHYWKMYGEKPTVIIRDHLLWLQNYIESANFLGASKWAGDIDDYKMRGNYLPLRFANQIFRNLDPWDHHDFENCMLDKYRLCGLPEDLWKTIDLKLSYETAVPPVQLYNGQPVYPQILYNESCQAGDIQICKLEPCPEIYKMQALKNFTVIDWWANMKHCFENHHVSTCTFFIMQAIVNKFPDSWNANFYVYPRPNDDGLRGISQLNPDFNLIRVTDGNN